MNRGTHPVDASRFRVDPDPPVAGLPVTVTYIGPASEVEWQVDGGTPTQVQPDRDGKFRIDPLPTGTELMLSDNLGLPGYLHRRIVNLNVDVYKRQEVNT